MDVGNNLNEKLKGAFGNKSDYDSASVLTLYWKDSDQDFYKEALKVQEFFGEKLGHTIDEFEIPTENSDVELAQKIDEFLLQNTSPRTLYVIHYGGHGVEDFNSAVYRRRQSVWAA